MRGSRTSQSEIGITNWLQGYQKAESLARHMSSNRQLTAEAYLEILKSDAPPARLKKKFESVLMRSISNEDAQTGETSMIGFRLRESLQTMSASDTRADVVQGAAGDL